MSSTSDDVLSLSSRTRLKQELLQLADEFQQLRRDTEKERLDKMEEEEKLKRQEEMSKNYAWKLVGRVMRKVMRRKKKGGAKGKFIPRQ